MAKIEGENISMISFSIQHTHNEFTSETFPPLFNGEMSLLVDGIEVTVRSNRSVLEKIYEAVKSGLKSIEF